MDESLGMWIFLTPRAKPGSVAPKRGLLLPSCKLIVLRCRNSAVAASNSDAGRDGIEAYEEATGGSVRQTNYRADQLILHSVFLPALYAVSLVRAPNVCDG